MAEPDAPRARTWQDLWSGPGRGHGRLLHAQTASKPHGVRHHPLARGGPSTPPSSDYFLPSHVGPKQPLTATVWLTHTAPIFSRMASIPYFWNPEHSGPRGPRCTSGGRGARNLIWALKSAHSARVTLRLHASILPQAVALLQLERTLLPRACDARTCARACAPRSKPLDSAQDTPRAA